MAAPLILGTLLLISLGICWSNDTEPLEAGFKLKSIFESAPLSGEPQHPVYRLSDDFYPSILGPKFSTADKVRYRSSDWIAGQTPHFNIYHYEDSKEAAGYAAQWAEEAYPRISRLLNQNYKKRHPIIIYPTPDQFRQTNIVDGLIPEGVGGFTDDSRRVVLPFTGSLPSDKHVLVHELVHQAQFSAFRDNRFRGRLPLWVTEGLAEYGSQNGIDTNTSMMLGEAAREGFLPTIEELGGLGDIRVYTMGHSIWQFIAENYGEDKITKIWEKITAKKKPMGLNGAFRQVLGKDIHQLSSEWTLALKRASFGDINNDAAGEIGKALTYAPRDGSYFNMAPALSPDGKSIAFISGGRDLLFGVYTGDVQAMTQSARPVKKPVRMLIEAERSETLESLGLLRGSIEWSPDGQQIAFAGFSLGDPALYIMNVSNRSLTKKIHLEELDEILYPSWSPEGSKLVFTGLKGGLSDLYIIDSDGSHLKRLTEDPFSNLHPSWSPDGKTIAFATDQSPGLPPGSLELTEPKIALYDLDTGKTRFLPNQIGRNVSPQWSADGLKIAYVSDRTGTYNIFLQDTQDEGLWQITNLITGVTGISRNGESPALSWSRNSGDFAFTTFDGKMNLNIYLLENSPRRKTAVDSQNQQLKPEKISLAKKGKENWTLAKRDFDEVKPYGAWPKPERLNFGLFTDLKSSLALFTMLNFSDLMRDQQISLLYLASGSKLKDFANGGVIASYTNQKRRLNWGGTFFQLDRPYLYSFESLPFYPWLGVTNPLYRGLALNLSYPLSRFQRLSGSIQAVDKISDGSGPYIYPHISYIRDKTVGFYYGPIDGSRLRLDAGQAVGSQSFTRLGMDARKYFAFKKAASFGLRVAVASVFGRDPQTIYIGGPGTVRGFPYGSIGGNTVALANAEIRFPFFPIILYPAFGLRTSMHLFADFAYTMAPSRLKSTLEAAGVAVNEAKASAGFGIRFPLYWFALGFDFAAPILGKEGKDSLVPQFSIHMVF